MNIVNILIFLNLYCWLHGRKIWSLGVLLSNYNLNNTDADSSTATNNKCKVLPMPGAFQGSYVCLSGFYCPTKRGCRDISKINILKFTIHSIYQTQCSIVIVNRRWFRTCGSTLMSYPNTVFVTGCHQCC